MQYIFHLQVTRCEGTPSPKTSFQEGRLYIHTCARRLEPEALVWTFPMSGATPDLDAAELDQNVNSFDMLLQVQPFLASNGSDSLIATKC